ncbi:hypothetical protein EPI10_006990 [Gossypium australe]|uniref:Uncharacterized protein n=1 Tax=Gossypium australe TaxID=47621 RepID=A0A5B6WSQ2_9ROSI|nr:hypothetical protein EPI10_006990 [Gossypium australe]
MEKIRRQCGFFNGIDVSTIGTRGGLSLDWRSEVSVVLRSFSNNHIDVNIEDSEVGQLGG